MNVITGVGVVPIRELVVVIIKMELKMFGRVSLGLQLVDVFYSHSQASES